MAVSWKRRTFAATMNFYVNTIPNILDIVVKGMLIGIIASAPMGPVGVLCVQRTLNKGRWYGFVTGCGAALSDMIYAGITGLGMGLVVDFVSNDTNRFYLQIAGSLMLLAFGLYTYRTDPTRKLRTPGQSKGTLTHNAITAFFVTLSNPLIIFLFMALYAQFAFGLLPDKPIEMIIGFISMFIILVSCVERLMEFVASIVSCSTSSRTLDMVRSFRSNTFLRRVRALILARSSFMAKGFVR